jgi:DNA-binding beta-propeller fold protein YncE
MVSVRGGALKGTGCAIAVALALLLPAGASAAFQPTGQFGSLGSGSGQIDAPQGIASDGAGKLFVPEFTNNRVSVFSTAGTFLYAFGWDVNTPDGDEAAEICTTACLPGDEDGGSGAIDAPQGIAYDSGNVYVADSDNSRIDVFNSAGVFQYAFGRDVNDPDGATTLETCTTMCIQGDSAGSSGALDGPTGLDVDGSNLYVADSNNHRVDVFTTAGSFQNAFGVDVEGADGGSTFEVCTASCRQGNFDVGNSGELDFPIDVVADGTGNLFVADPGNNFRVSAFNVGGVTPAFSYAFGYDVDDPDGDAAPELCVTTCRQGDYNFSGAAEAGMIEPFALALDSAGNLQIADLDGNRVSVFTPAAEFVHAFGFGVDTGASAFQFCTLDSTCQTGGGGTGSGELNRPFGIETDGADTYVAELDNNRISRFGEPAPTSPPATTSVPITAAAPVPCAGLSGRALKKCRCKQKPTKAKRKKCLKKVLGVKP